MQNNFIKTFIKIILISFLFSSIAHAQERYKIILGSYSSQKRADKGLKYLNKFLAEQKELVSLQNAHNFYSDTQAIGSHYAVLIEPFADRKVLYKVLKIVRSFNSDAFVSTFKIPDEVISEAPKVKEDVKNTNASEVITPLVEEVIEENQTVQVVEKIEETVVTKVEERVEKVEVQEAKPKQSKPTSTKKKPQEKLQTGQINKLVYFAFGALIFIFLIIILYLIKKNKTLLENANFSYADDVQKNYNYFNNIEAFLSKMSEELRAPISTIINLSDEVLTKKIGPDEYHDINQIKNSALTSLNIVNDLLDLSYINTGKLKLKRKTFDINELLVQISDETSPKAREKGLELVYHVDHSVPCEMVGDSVRLGQIFINLIDNAIIHTHEGRVEFTIDTVKEHYASKIGLVFSVIDQGNGMDEDTASNLFKNGKDLDLYITKNLVDAMEGSIEVNTAITVGSEFVVTLFLTKTDMDNRRFYRLPSKELMKKNVILIDTHAHSNKSLINMLNYFKYDVKVANSIEVAKNMLENTNCDMLFLDEENLTANLDQQLVALKEKFGFHAILMHAIDFQKESSDVNLNLFESFLLKPFNQGMIYNLIVNLYPDIEADEETYEESIEEILEENRVTTESLHEYNFSDLDVKAGLQNCDMSKNTYISFLEDFINMYENANSVLEGMIDEQRYEDAQVFIDDLKSFAHHIGGNKVYSSANEIETVFTQKSYNKLPVLINLFTKNIEQLIANIQEFKKQKIL